MPKIPVGVSGTALAASLLRDGWSVSYNSVACLTLFISLLTHFEFCVYYV